MTKAIVMPSEVKTNVKASDMGGWIPPTAIKPVKPIIKECVFQEKSTKPGEPDYKIVMDVAGIECKAFASTLKGAYKAKYGNPDAMFTDAKTGTKVTGVTLADNILVGYEDNTGTSKEQFPRRLVVEKR